MSIGILEIHQSVTIRADSAAFSGQLSQNHLPFGVAPAPILGKIIGQLPGEGAAIEVQIARFVHPVQLFGQVFLIIIALALIRQGPVEGAVGIHAGSPHAEHKGRRLAVAVLLKADGTIIIEFDDLQRTGFLFAVPAQRGAVVLLIPAAAMGSGKLFRVERHKCTSFLLHKTPSVIAVRCHLPLGGRLTARTGPISEGAVCEADWGSFL